LVRTWACIDVNAAQKAIEMTLGFHYHLPAEIDEKGNIRVPGYLGVFLDGLADAGAERILCFLHTPLPQERKLLDYAIRSKRIDLVDIGPHDSMFKRAVYPSKYLVNIKRNLERIDFMLIRGPSPLLPFVASLCKRKSVDYGFLLVGDYLKGLAGATLPWYKRVLLWSFYRFNKFGQDRFAKDALIIANNKVIYEEYARKKKDVCEIRTTTLQTENFYKREDTCEGETIKVAYAGRIEPAKGIDDMIVALSKLRDDGYDVELHIAGWDPSKNESYLPTLFRLAETYGMRRYFHFHGKKNVGDELMAFYRSCDIFLIASKGNEGFPRTIWEAMSQSMPVVASAVGSIPIVLEDEKEVLLIAEGNISDIYAKIEKLIASPQLRKRLIRYGYEKARESTIEVQSQKLMRCIVNYKNGKREQ
jgi:glycosyltransferase involved in cell wall biosynthesis